MEPPFRKPRLVVSPYSSFVTTQSLVFAGQRRVGVGFVSASSNRRDRRHRWQRRGRHRLLDRADTGQLRCLGGCGPSFHDLENRASPISDTPAAVHPLDETLGEYIQVGHAGCQSLCAFGPVRSAGRQNRHIALEVRHGGEPVWIADQHLENHHLEVHCPTRARLPRTYFLYILGAFVSLCRLTRFTRWFSLEMCGEKVRRWTDDG